MAIIEVRDLTKRFGQKVLAVDQVSFKVKKSEILGLLGPNGAGKTSTIQMMLGLLTPDNGSVSLFGRDIATGRQQILGRVNFSSAYVQLPYNLTVLELMTIFSHLYSVANYKTKIERLIEEFELGRFIKTPAGRLSSGEQTRLNLAKALLNDPEILFLDEPTASLDPLAARSIRTLLKSIHRQRSLTIVYTSHNMAEVSQLVNQIVFMYQGRIVARGTPAQIIKKQKSKNLEAAFLALSGDPSGQADWTKPTTTGGGSR